MFPELTVVDALLGPAPEFFAVDDRLRWLRDLCGQIEVFQPDLENALAYMS